MSAPVKPLVWVVDDSALERSRTVRALGDKFDFEQFGDGAEVIERIGTTEKRPDVVILDWVMPTVSGDEVCRYLRAHAETFDLPVILVTASRVETDDIVQGLSLGANDYVAKPFAPEELVARVATVLRAKDLREAASRERRRLHAIDRLGRALFEAGHNTARVLEELIASTVGVLADGCAITLLPGPLPPYAGAVHRRDSSAALLRGIADLADPTTYAFRDDADARETLPRHYHAYIERFGLRGLAILPFPIRGPVQGVITLTRDRMSQPFDADDLAAITTCIEYASLAVQNATRFHAEQAARAQLDAIVGHAPIGIVFADATGALTLANPAASRMIPGIAEGQQVESVPPLARAWGQDGEARHEVVLETGVLAVTCVSVTGDHAGRVFAIEDVSASHAMNADRERVAAFQEQMLGIVGHDLRNPLGAIMTSAEMLAMEHLDPAMLPRIAARIRSSGKRMTGIVNQLLDVTRARLGTGIPLSLGEVALVPVARGVVDELGIAYPNTKFELDAADVSGRWDGDRLGQVISNLGSNAAQYGSSAQPVRVTIRRTPTHAVIAVHNALKDRPIPPDQLATLFAPYRRGAGSAQAYRGGLGLGLYITSEIVRAHAGAITAASDETGTTFTVELPIQR